MHGSFNDAIHGVQDVPPLIAGVAKLQNVGSEARSTISTKSNEIDEMNAQIRANIAEAANGGGGGGAAAEESHDEVAALVTQRESLVAQQLSRIADATLELRRCEQTMADLERDMVAKLEAFGLPSSRGGSVDDEPPVVPSSGGGGGGGAGETAVEDSLAAQPPPPPSFDLHQMRQFAEKHRTKVATLRSETDVLLQQVSQNFRNTAACFGTAAASSSGDLENLGDAYQQLHAKAAQEEAASATAIAEFAEKKSGFAFVAGRQLQRALIELRRLLTSTKDLAEELDGAKRR